MSSVNNKVVLIGYSGHAFVAADIFHRNEILIAGYCDAIVKENNPFGLTYFGNYNSNEAKAIMKKCSFFIAIGNNQIRSQIFKNLSDFQPINAQDPSAIVSKTSTLGPGVMIGAGVKINAFASIGTGVICNTGAIIEHECCIGDFVHLAPGSVLCGNVSIGENSFIGANAVIKQGVKIGKNVTIGAGSVVLKDIDDNCTLAGNPAKILK